MLMATNTTQKSTKSYPSRQLDEFAGYSTLHGFHFVFENHFVLRRIIWAILLIIGILLFGIQLQESIGKLKSHRTIISREIDYSSELAFPAFTLCNVNMMKKSKIIGTDAQYFLDSFDPLKTTAERKEAQEKMNVSFDLEQAVLENGHKASDMVLMCMWKNEPCDYHNFTTFVTEENGLCHTFNSGTRKDHTLWSKTNTKDDGLTLLINVEPNEYYGPTSLLSSGVQIMIHDQELQPRRIRSYGIDLMPGVISYLRLKKEKIISLPTPFKSACGVRKLQTSKTYSKEACLFECYTRLVNQKCGCRLLGMPILAEFNKTKHCSPKEIFQCSGKKDELSLLKCDCPIPCERIVYKVQQTTAYFPAYSFWPKMFAMLPNHANISSLSEIEKSLLEQTVRQSMMLIQVSFQDLNMEVITEHPTYEFSDLIADVGGILGLFLGCSILTIFEFVDFFIVLLFGARKSPNNRKAKTEEEMPGGVMWNKAVEEKLV